MTRPIETLVIHPGALGDVLQAVPALSALERGGHRLTFAGQPRLGELLQGMGLVLAAFTFSPPDTFRPQLEAALGVALPSWPIANPWLSFVAAFLLLLITVPEVKMLALRRVPDAAAARVPIG